MFRLPIAQQRSFEKARLQVSTENQYEEDTSQSYIDLFLYYKIAMFIFVISPHRNRRPLSVGKHIPFVDCLTYTLRFRTDKPKTFHSLANSIIKKQRRISTVRLAEMTLTSFSKYFQTNTSFCRRKNSNIMILFTRAYKTLIGAIITMPRGFDRREFDAF